MEIRVNDVNLYYEQIGIGKPIVLSHGWLDDCSVWHHQVELFSKDHAVIIYDHRGHGRSDKPRKDYSVTTLANDMHTLIEELKLQDVTLIGFSLGGEAALVCTLMYPEKISKLVLVGVTAAYTGAAEPQFRLVKATVPELQDHHSGYEVHFTRD